MTAFLKSNEELDGGLASIFRQGLPNPQTEWGSLTSAPGEQNRDANSLSPQSPFEYRDNLSPQGNRSAARGKPASTFSLLRPQASERQVSLSPLDTLQLLQASSCQRMDAESIFQGVANQAGNNQWAVNSVDSRSGHEQSSGEDQQRFVVDFFPPQPAQPVAQTSSWINSMDCEVDQLAGELESEIMRDRMSPQPVFPHYYPNLPYAQTQSHLMFQANRGGDWSSLLAQGGQQQQQTRGVPRGIEALRNGDGALDPRMEQQQNLGAGGASGLQLVHLLLACAEAVSNEQMDLANVILMRLSSLVVPRGNTMQRLTAVFVDALTARINKATDTRLFLGLHKDKSIPVLDILESFSVVYDCTPLGKFPHLTLNQIILDAVERESSIHIIDLNTGWRGMQWPAFIQALALRSGGPPSLRITSVGTFEDLEHSKEKLLEYARNLNVPIEFSPIAEDLKVFNIQMLDIREGEALCINSFSQLHQILCVGDERFQRFLCDLRSLNPRVLALSENDADHNNPAFLHRFVECLKYYSAVFDAFDASVPPGSRALVKIEQLFSGQKIRNIIACEGVARIERHETMISWGRRLMAAGFRPSPISSRAISQARLLLNLYYHSGYTLSIENGYVGLGWKHMGLLGVSAWQQ